MTGGGNKRATNETVLSSGMLSHRDCVPCSLELGETELALDSFDVLGLIVADEIAEDVKKE
jgi:hypothetical protein